MKIEYKISRARTCWWSNDWKPSRVFRIREDHLFSLTRAYVRGYQYYGYKLIIGRLRVVFYPKLPTTFCREPDEPEA